MKTIRVVAAVIRDGDRVFATQRGYGPRKDGWEFPGGKIEPGETPEAALAREIREELDGGISVGDKLIQVERDEEDFHLSMSCYFCTLLSGRLTLKEHEAAKWLKIEEIDSVAWLPADQIAVEKLKEAWMECGKPAEKKIAVILPGIGYTCDKPLLYYSGKLAQSLGWEVVRVPYGGFPPKVQGDWEKMRQSADIALEQTEKMLRETDWTSYGQILFISKSVGTVTAGAYAGRHQLRCRHILFTPVEDTFSFPLGNAFAFHGTADPWADTETIKRLCRESGVPLYITENANHSLETGDVQRDIRNLETVMNRVKALMKAQDKEAAG